MMRDPAIDRAVAPLWALHELDDDDRVGAALEEFVRRAQTLRRGQLVRAAFVARDALACARPCWSSDWRCCEFANAIGCVLAEHDRKRRAAQPQRLAS